jgi:hypothetical protein
MDGPNGARQGGLNRRSGARGPQGPSEADFKTGAVRENIDEQVAKALSMPPGSVLAQEPPHSHVPLAPLGNSSTPSGSQAVPQAKPRGPLIDAYTRLMMDPNVDAEKTFVSFREGGSIGLLAGPGHPDEVQPSAFRAAIIAELEVRQPEGVPPAEYRAAVTQYANLVVENFTRIQGGQVTVKAF